MKDLEEKQNIIRPQMHKALKIALFPFCFLLRGNNKLNSITN
jgi:hypothetical protein